MRLGLTGIRTGIKAAEIPGTQANPLAENDPTSMMAATEGRSPAKEAQPVAKRLAGAATADSDVIEFVKSYQIPEYTGSAGAWIPSGQSTIEQMLNQMYDPSVFGRAGTRVSRKWRSARRKDSWRRPESCGNCRSLWLS